MSRWIGLVVVVVVLGCSRTPTESQGRDVATGVPHNRAAPSNTSSAPSVVASSTAAPRVSTSTASSVIPSSEDAEQPFRFPAAERVVAIGDLHGDLTSAREALRLAGAIDEKDHWAGGKLVLVQVGDQLDRGDDEPEILRLLEQLAIEAPRSGGAVHVLNGNHELMNAAGDLRYVTEDGLLDYAKVQAPPSARLPASVPEVARGRWVAFAPGSELARKLAERNTIVIIGDTVFVHAGVLSKHVKYGVGRINDEVRRFLRGETTSVPEIAMSEDAPIWTRLYGDPNPSSEACSELQAVLSALSVKRMVVGHTVQQAGVAPACDGRVYRVDVGLSDYYGNNATQVLELRPTGVRILGANAVGGSR